MAPRPSAAAAPPPPRTPPPRPRASPVTGGNQLRGRAPGGAPQASTSQPRVEGGSGAPTEPRSPAPGPYPRRDARGARRSWPEPFVMLIRADITPHIKAAGTAYKEAPRAQRQRNPGLRSALASAAPEQTPVRR